MLTILVNMFDPLGILLPTLLGLFVLRKALWRLTALPVAVSVWKTVIMVMINHTIFAEDIPMIWGKAYVSAVLLSGLIVVVITLRDRLKSPEGSQADLS